MFDFHIAVKAFILDGKGRLLLIKRRFEDVHIPGYWDIPGGRVALGDNPVSTLRQEVKKEVSLDIEIVMPLDVRHFVRDDGQKMTMLIFLCQPTKHKIELSQKHSEYRWVEIDENSSDIPEWLVKSVENYSSTRLNEIVSYIDNGHSLVE